MSGEIATWASVVTPALVGLFGVILSLLQYRRANYERAERLLDHVPTGDVATARHLLGSEPWVRAPSPSPHTPGADDNALIEALFRVAWAFDRIWAVRRTVRFGPRRLIDDIVGDWVAWWGADQGDGCRYGRTAATLGALDPQEHEHLRRLVASLTTGGNRACTGIERHQLPGPSNPASATAGSSA